MLVLIVVLRHVFNVLCHLRANKLVQFSSVQFPRHQKQLYGAQWAGAAAHSITVYPKNTAATPYQC
jgi:hypothetical protein